MGEGKRYFDTFFWGGGERRDYNKITKRGNQTGEEDPSKDPSEDRNKADRGNGGIPLNPWGKIQRCEEYLKEEGEEEGEVEFQ